MPISQEIYLQIKNHKNSEKIFELIKQLQHMLVEHEEVAILAIAYIGAKMSEGVADTQE